MGVGGRFEHRVCVHVRVCWKRNKVAEKCKFKKGKNTPVDLSTPVSRLFIYKE